MRCMHSWITALFGHSWHIFDIEISYSTNKKKLLQFEKLIKINGDFLKIVWRLFQKHVVRTTLNLISMIF
jgi:hypothetical protein